MVKRVAEGKQANTADSKGVGDVCEPNETFEGGLVVVLPNKEQETGTGDIAVASVLCQGIVGHSPPGFIAYAEGIPTTL